MARGKGDPEYGPNDLKAEICRALEAVEHGGFDGKEHPERMPQVDAMLSVLYPIDEFLLTKLVTGRASVLN